VKHVARLARLRRPGIQKTSGTHNSYERGHVETLMNCAGIALDWHPASELTVEALQKTCRVD
jgi:hypothetical protein